MALGRFPEARAALADGTELCRRWDRESLGWTHMFYCAIVLWGGDPAGPETVAHARQAVEIADQIGDAFSRIGAIGWLGMAHTLTGEHDEAAPHLGRALEMIEELHANLEFEPGIRSYRAEGIAARGDLDAAIEEADLAVRVAEERHVTAYLPRLQTVTARLLVSRAAPGDAERAAALLDSAEQLAGRLGQRPDTARAAIVRAELHEAGGDAEAAERERAAAREQATEMDAKGLLAELEPEAARA
jgi:tetratricopeptide (TPR) repeat protein